MSIDGLPLHPLVVHAAVILTPAAALLVLLYVVVARWRRVLRHPALVLALVAAVAVEVAYLSGKAFVEDVPQLGQAVAEHGDIGRQLVWAVWIFAVLAALAWWALPAPGARGAQGPTVLVPVVATVVAVAAGVVLWLAFRAGHTGATAVWGGILQ